MIIGLLSIIIYFFVMVPTALRAGGWSDLYYILILPFLMLGILENIIGLYLFITKNKYQHITTYLGLIYSIFGFLYIFYFYYFALLFIFPGIILIYLGVKPELRTTW